MPRKPLLLSGLELLKARFQRLVQQYAYFFRARR
jgi:hypothetical protein